MKIALLGTGLMGTPMAQKLLEIPHQVTVYNRTKAKALALREHGAIIADSPQLAIASAEVIILMLTNAQAIRDVLFENHLGVLNGKTVIQMGTISPLESQDLARQIQERSGYYLECPVLGSRKEAAEGRLLLMVGCEKELYERWKELLRVFGPEPRWIGCVGKAASLKLALNQIIAAHAVTFSWSLAFLEKHQVDSASFIKILKESALYAPMFDKKINRWIKHDYLNPNFPVKHLIKDIQLIIDEAEHVGLDSHVIQAMRVLYTAAMNQNLSEKDYSAVYESIRQKRN